MTAAAPLALQRLRWKSRRGWLELDLLLADFWRKHGDTLSAEEETLLAQWLEMDDEHLWALLRTPPATGTGATLAKKLRPAAHGAHGTHGAQANTFNANTLNKETQP